MFRHLFDYILSESLRDGRSSNEDVRFDLLDDCEQVIVLFTLPLGIIASIWLLRGRELVAVGLEQ